MLLKLKMKLKKSKLNKCVKKYGLNDEKTIKTSEKVNELINKYYRKHSK